MYIVLLYELHACTFFLILISNYQINYMQLLYQILQDTQFRFDFNNILQIFQMTEIMFYFIEETFV